MELKRQSGMEGARLEEILSTYHRMRLCLIVFFLADLLFIRENCVQSLL